MIEKNIDVTSPRLDPVKSCGCAVVFLIQSCFSLETEQNFSKIKWFNSIFVRVRDVLVSDYLKTVYFPIPKSACTLLATMLALHDPQTRDFDPEAEGVHRYRFRKNALRPKDLSVFSNKNYFKFTVVRNPYNRIVSGYIDKFVKPFILNPKLDRGLATKWTFEKLVDFLVSNKDNHIDKHWRSQHLFFKNVELDYIGAFENMEDVNRKIKEVFGIEIDTQVSPRVYKKARTQYNPPEEPPVKPVCKMTPLEIADWGKIPSYQSFLTPRIRKLIEKRYAKDFEVYSKVATVS